MSTSSALRAASASGRRLLSTTTSKPFTVSIIGGTGFLGTHIADRFKQANSKVNVILHSRQQKPTANTTSSTKLDIVTEDASSISTKLGESDVVINCVGIMYETLPTYTFDSVQHRSLEKLSQVIAKQDRIKKLVHISAIGADKESVVPYARSKALGEEAIQEALGKRAVIIRPSLVFGPEDEFFNRFAQLAKYLPFLPVFGGGATRFQPVSVDDVADLVYNAVTTDTYDGKIVETGGPKVYTYREMMELMLKSAGMSRLLVSLPWTIGYVQAFFLEKLPRSIFTLTQDQITLLKKDNVVNMESTHYIGKRRAEDILPSYLSK